jgi:hypothetical protein
MPPDVTIPKKLLPSILQRRVTGLVGARPIQASVVTAGFTLARRWVIKFDNGVSVFLKAAGNSCTADWLRKEHKIYQSLSSSYLPRVVGWFDQPPGPFLLLEDLSTAHWPPPWSFAQVQMAIETLRDVHRSGPKLDLPRLGPQVKQWRSWHRVAADPTLFLSLKLCSPQWLHRVLSKLIEAENLATLEGEDLVHGDFRSGNICFVGGRTIVIDWNWAAIGNGLFDIATWLPTLVEETGCRPQEILPGQAPLAALVAGHLAFVTGKPPPSQAPRLREFQLRKLRHALAWVCYELSLPAMDD